jgi:superfamily II DNA helicase RecQ
MASQDALPNTAPLLSQLRDLTMDKMGVRPCLFQLKFAEALLKRDRDVLLEAGCGSGKTLGFWIPLLYNKNGIQIVITALNLLGKQNVESLQRAGINGISINAETATQKNFQVEPKSQVRNND